MILDRSASEIITLKKQDPYLYKRFKNLFKASPPQICSARGHNGFKYLNNKKQWEAKIPSAARLVNSKPSENGQIIFDKVVAQGYHS